MRQFVGCVIDESLADIRAVAGLTPVASRRADMPGDPDAEVWHTRWYLLDAAQFERLLPAVTAAMRPHWYAHFWSGDDLCVILAGRHFWASASDKATWEPFIQYGNSVGVERKWTERISTTLPGWVEAALGQASGATMPT